LGRLRSRAPGRPPRRDPRAAARLAAVDYRAAADLRDLLSLAARAVDALSASPFRAANIRAVLVDEIQEVYRLQGVNINDRHIEVVVRQMMRWVKIEEVGDTEFLIDEVVDKFRFISENERISALGKKPSAGRPLLLA
jgi:hypothetical protein